MRQTGEFGRRVRRAREDLGISRRRLAQLLGIDPLRVEMIEIGQTDRPDLTSEELVRMSNVLGRSRYSMLRSAPCFSKHRVGNLRDLRNSSPHL